MLQRLLMLFGLLALTACAAPAVVDEPPVDMGNFKLGHVAVVVSEPEQGPLSRNASDSELADALETAIRARFGGYDGDNFYHIGVKLDLYALALPGVPVVLSPKSVFIVTVTFWDDATQSLLSEEGGKGLTVYEGASAETVVSSGLFRNKSTQMKILADNTAKAIQDWILENPDWIGLSDASDVTDTDN